MLHQLRIVLPTEEDGLDRHAQILFEVRHSRRQASGTGRFSKTARLLDPIQSPGITVPGSAKATFSLEDATVGEFGVAKSLELMKFGVPGDRARLLISKRSKRSSLS